MIHKRREVLIAGAGGQGIVLAGTILSTAVIREGKYATQTTSYGTETRGTLSETGLIISNHRIGYPVTDECDILIVMTQNALDRNLTRLREGGLVLVDGDMVHSVPAGIKNRYGIPATRIAERELGSKTFANMVMLGGLAATSGVADLDACRGAIRDAVPPETIELNIAAFNLGVEYAGDHTRTMS